jgi:hypothetical protein
MNKDLELSLMLLWNVSMGHLSQEYFTVFEDEKEFNLGD